MLLICYFFKISHSPASCLLSLLHVPPSHKKIYIPLSLVHLINSARDNCMRQNACILAEMLMYNFALVHLMQTLAVSQETRLQSSNVQTSLKSEMCIFFILGVKFRQSTLPCSLFLCMRLFFPTELELVSCHFFILLPQDSKSFPQESCYHKLESRSHQLASRSHKLESHYHKMLTCSHKLAKSLPQDTESFPQVSNLFPQVTKSFPQDTKSFPQVSRLLPQVSKSCFDANVQ